MKYKFIVVSLIIILSVTSYLFGEYRALHRVIDSTRTRQEPNFSVSTPYLGLVVQQCSDDINVSDRFVCIADLASTTLVAADTIADKLIIQSPKRLKELTSVKDAPMSWEYGGEEFLKNLPQGVLSAQEARDKYFNGVCGLDSMVIFGSSGIGLEIEACRYYYAKQFLAVLQRLEGGLTAKSSSSQ